MNLVVVESPSKAKTIGKYLGKGYVVKASKGHVVDLPKSGLGINVEDNFKPEYIITNPTSLSDLKKSFKDADKLILAVDLDREGEAIGWHIARELNVIDENGKPKGKKPFERIVFHEITKGAIEEAINNPRAIDLNLVNAQQARRLLDRIVGYKLSPLLWKKITFGLSAGRVQSVALRLVVDREDERNAFIKDEYWSVDAMLAKKKSSKVKLTYQKIDTKEKDISDVDDNSSQEGIIREGLIKFSLFKVKNNAPELKTEDECIAIVSAIEEKKWIISDLKTSEQKRNPRAPFITSTLQQSGVNKLGFSAKRTMGAAQKLYEAGYISYMRTDSVNMSNLAIEQAREFIAKKIGKVYLPEKINFYKSSNKSAQEAHECIRPSNFSDTSDSLNLEGDLKRVYDLIWQRALASQMKPAILSNTDVYIDIDPYLFKASGKRMIFDGFLRVYKEKFDDNIIPDVKVGEELYPDEILSAQHFTQPPARYSEATLIKKMEELGIGRPSTYASIISTIVSRKYVENMNKYLVPTDTGIVVNKLLVKYFSDIVDYGFTANMENDLDKIANGDLEWLKMLKDFYIPFEKEVLERDKTIPRGEFTELGKSDEKCPECGSPMLIKLGRYGRFLSCSRYPDCKGIKAIEEPQADGTPAEPLDLTKYEGAPKTEDGREFVLKTSRFGKFWAHPDYPKVKDSRSLILLEKCPLSGHGLVERKGKWGKTFIGCSDYPNCKYIKGAKNFEKIDKGEKQDIASVKTKKKAVTKKTAAKKKVSKKKK